MPGGNILGEKKKDKKRQKKPTIVSKQLFI